MNPLTENYLTPELEARLFNIGGWGINLTEPLKQWRQTQSYLNQTAYQLEHGQEFSCTDSILVIGDSGHCHANTAALYFLSHGQLEMWTGWGLNDIGGWTEHTWGIYQGRIYDSAGKWHRYFGIKPAQQKEWATHELTTNHRWKDDPKDFLKLFSIDSDNLLTKLFYDTMPSKEADEAQGK
jgi:hypothetical protein